jgi:hypothetical protein
MLLLFNSIAFSVVHVSAIQLSMREMEDGAPVKLRVPSSPKLSHHSKRYTPASTSHNPKGPVTQDTVWAAEDRWNHPTIGIGEMLDRINRDIKDSHQYIQSSSKLLKQGNQMDKTGRKAVESSQIISKNGLQTSEHARRVLVEEAMKVQEELPGGHDLHPKIEALLQHPLEHASTLSSKAPKLDASAAKNFWEGPVTGVRANLKATTDEVQRRHKQVQDLSKDPSNEHLVKSARANLRTAQSLGEIWVDAAKRIKDALPEGQPEHDRLRAETDTYIGALEGVPKAVV